MKCPYLEETQVKYCRHCAIQKMIVRTASYLPDEKCSSPQYNECPTFQQHDGDGVAASSTCPFLKEARVQYCAASPIRKFVPHSVGRASRCNGTGYRYCDAYLKFCQPAPRWRERRAPAEAPSRSEWTETRGIRIPAWLYYAPNHLWIDPGEDGLCHVGIDAFLARVIGRLERLSFVPLKGVGRPVAFMTVEGADLQIVFPNSLSFCEAHLHLRANPSRVITDPYTHGWLFKGYDPGWRGARDRSVLAGLLPGRDAAEWMRADIDRLSRLLRESRACESRTRESPPPQAAAVPSPGHRGGEPEEGIIQRLAPGQTFALFNEFFSPYRNWTRPA